jgi:anti-sigma regulatory factor (Ser/Thr protein kinase)/anti-anti-sigma regulatory factor
VEITVGQHGDRPVVDVSGVLDVAAAGQLRAALLKAAADQPEAVLCDLTHVRAERLALPVFLNAADEIRAWPSCPLVLVVPGEALRAALERLGVDRRVLVVRSAGDVDAALTARPPAARAVLRLPSTRSTPGRARSFLRTCLRAWHADDAAEVDLEGAVLVLGELVTNAVVHAGTPVEVLVSLRGSVLRVAVADQSPGEPRLRAAANDEENGRGLELVEALAWRWGVLPRGSGGKVVWAVVPGTSGPDPR